MSPNCINDRVPELVVGANSAAFPLTPQEYYVYSRVDGVSDVTALSEACGMSVDAAAATVNRLLGHGLLSLSDVRSAASSDPRRPRPLTPPGGSNIHSMVHTRPPPPGTSRALYDPAELEEEGVDLDWNRRRQVLDTFYRLQEVDHYALLGVERSADKKALRDAYFSLAKVFHPDTLFGKEIGSFKSKMEVVFKHLTDAYEVLGKKKARSEYDEYLGFKDATGSVTREMDEVSGAAEAFERGESRLPSEPPVHKPPSAPAPKHRKASIAERRADMARRLAAATGRSARGSTMAPEKAISSQPPPASKTERLKSLQRSLQGAAAVHGASVKLKERHTEAASEAESRKDWVGAANALRLAMAADPDDETLRERHAAVKVKVDRHLADAYQHQAMYEEDHGNWEAAARSWRRVAAGRPDDHRPLLHASQALLIAKRDLHEARDLAVEAKRLAPKNINPICTLAEIYMQLGLTKSAHAEISAALKLDPKSEIVKNLQRTLKS